MVRLLPTDTVLRPCGHVLCTPCTSALVTEPLERGADDVACPQCSVPVPRRRDVIALVREGTGYAGGGVAEVHAKGTAFQG